ncbi:MAG TPA: DUF3641 domain-containing protein [Nitrospirae bacterium]|nr:DUF3641 domain-containing protein [Nitrospirota bacterium]HDK17551.1 DUF3641 domain-containing protein [Nitrospirota bacterium]HDO26258.1 DUF3641 domain-containing protein [Nitrospirota bacterium]
MTLCQRLRSTEQKGVATNTLCLMCTAGAGASCSGALT